MTVQLDVNAVSVHYAQRCAVDAVSFALDAGAIGCLLGPSGCGKTTLLRAVAGFETLSSGVITLHQQQLSTAVSTVPPERRRVGMVFQEFALFPHLRVSENIAFGLQKMPARQRQQRVTELLDMIGLPETAQRYPHQLSGGQQQRVALARAIAPRPDVLLLDEPFSSLDAELRTQLAQEVRDLLKREGMTALLVTHDQEEAFAFADQVGVLHGGRLQQWDTPYGIYHRPATRFVAEFVGQGSVIQARVSGGQLQSSLGLLGHTALPDGTVQILLRPDDIVFDAGSAIRLPIVQRAFRGAEYVYTLQTEQGERVFCMTPSHVELTSTGTLPVRLDLQHLVIFADA